MTADLVGLADRLVAEADFVTRIVGTIGNPEVVKTYKHSDATRDLLREAAAELRALGGGDRADFIKGYVYAADRLAQPSLSIDAIQARAELAAEREGYDSPSATVEG